MKKFIQIVSISLITFSGYSTEYKLTKSDTFMYLGTQSYKSKDIIQAKKMLDSCIILNPNNDECIYRRGVIAFEENEFELSKSIFKAVLSLKDKDYAAWNYLGLSFQELKQFDSAEFCFKNAVVLNSKESKFYANWAKNEYLRGNYSHADELYQTAQFLDPNYANFYIGRTEVLKKLGKKEDAISNLKKATEIFPENKEIQKQLDTLSPAFNFNILILFIAVFVAILGFLYIRKKKSIK